MKTITLSFALLLSVVLKGQQFVQYVPFDSTLVTGHATVIGCNQTIQSQIKLDTSLYNYVNGLKFLLILDTVHFYGPNCSIHSGDTIILNSTNPIFTTISSNIIGYWYRIKIVGTPITLNQNYPCKIQTMVCICSCLDVLIKKSSVDNSVCNVGLFNNIYVSEKKYDFNVYPNPAINKFTISGIVEQSTIRLYSSLGEIKFEKEINSDFIFDTRKLSDGIYSLFVYNASSGFTSRKIIIENK